MWLWYEHGLSPHVPVESALAEKTQQPEEVEDKEHWQALVDELWSSAQQRHNNQLRLRAKKDALWLWRPLHWLLRLVTFGQSIDLVDGNYYALIGRTLWMPGDGSLHHKRAPHLLLSILSHEIDHLDWVYFGDHNARDLPPESLRQTSALFRLLHWWKYLCWPFPFRWARYREKIEVWGHERNLEQHLIGTKGKCARWYRKWLVMQFSSSTYAWMCSQTRAFEVVDQMIERVEAAYARGDLDVYKPS